MGRPNRLADSESVENCGFIAVLGSLMRQLCARWDSGSPQCCDLGSAAIRK
jgi:hypothetical protein